MSDDEGRRRRASPSAVPVPFGEDAKWFMAGVHQLDSDNLTALVGEDGLAMSLVPTSVNPGTRQAADLNGYPVVTFAQTGYRGTIPPPTPSTTGPVGVGILYRRSTGTDGLLQTPGGALNFFNDNLAMNGGTNAGTGAVAGWNLAIASIEDDTQNVEVNGVLGDWFSGNATTFGGQLDIGIWFGNTNAAWLLDGDIAAIGYWRGAHFDDRQDFKDWVNSLYGTSF